MGKPTHVEVTLKQVGGDSEKLVKRFCKRVKKAGVFDEMRRRRYFKSKSQRLREKRASNEHRKKRYCSLV